MDIETLIASSVGSGSFVVDAGIAAGVCEATNWVKERLDEWTWDDKFARLYPIIPFICAFGLCWLMAGLPIGGAGLVAVAKNAGIYGVYSTVGWNVWKKTVKGE